ncbi:hypothetical protein BBO_08197 [Beauveria brongniartii RCEF 3172]|uniref:Uncharacterized protein n=1 Tax=Beauveria brongniartii RCEF 3172 TaxID=1081107 RepID=A0A166XY13_9HYPO|nr:hypothetical protein BBO_08197 [Beauveria brongniartii RCEF 3172]
MYSAELVYITPYLMSAEKRREVSRINSAASSRKNSLVATGESTATSAAPSRAASPAPKKEKKSKKHDPLRSAVKMNINSRLL